MKQKHWLLIVTAVVMVLVLPACELRAATPPAPTATAEGGFPVPGTETMGIFETIATQTAMAGGGGVAAPTAEAAQATQGAAGETPVSPPAAVDPTAVPSEAPVIVNVPTATPGIPSTYTLQKGEFPYCIARRFNVNPYELLQLNGLGTNTIVQPGTSLRIPQTGNSFPDGRSLHSHPTTYSVRTGDTIYSVACYFGDADPNMIALANNLSSPYTLNAGTTIQIP